MSMLPKTLLLLALAGEATGDVLLSGEVSDDVGCLQGSSRGWKQAALEATAKLEAVSSEKTMLEAGRQLSRQFQQLAQALPEGDTKDVFDSLQICGHCENFKRVGEKNDGGYVTCMDNMKSAVAALSVGVEHHDQWSADTAHMQHIPVSQFDCTVESGASCGLEDGCHFHQLCLVSRDRHERDVMTLSPNVTLSDAVKVSVPGGHARDRSLLLKIDCEGCEWPIFEVEDPQVLKQFSQLIVEFHGLGTSQFHRMYAAALRNLHNAGFKVVHIHGNNFAGTYYPIKDVYLSVPMVLEVTLVADVPWLEGGCKREQDYNKDLDAPNDGKKEMAMARLERSE